MLKKVLVMSMLLVLIITSSALAAIETQGDVVFRDALYGAIVGAIVGGALYVIDEDDFAQKVGAGVLIGTAGGLVFGVMETKSVVEINHDEVKFAMPTPVIQKKGEEMIFAAPLLKVDLD